MNYHLLEYSELKQEAKQRRIKMYYTMRKALLIQLLSMKELPEQYIVEKKRIGELKVEARARGIPGAYLLNRQALVEMLYPHLYRKSSSQEQYKNHNSTKEHDYPKKHHAE